MALVFVAMPLVRGLRESGRGCRMNGLAGDSGQEDSEGGALVHLTGDLDPAFVLLNNAVTDGKAEAGSLAIRHGGEEGIEYPGEVLRGDAMAGIGEFDLGLP